MQRFLFIVVSGFIGVAASIWPVSLAEETVLEISVTGMIKEPPQWVNRVGKQIRTITFNFANLAQSNPMQDVKSDAVELMLKYADSYPASVTFVSPRDCRIGTRVISEKDIQLVQDGSSFKSEGTFLLGSEAVSRYFLVFAARGGYASASGFVSCGVPGALVYAY